MLSILHSLNFKNTKSFRSTHAKQVTDHVLLHIDRSRLNDDTYLLELIDNMRRLHKMTDINTIDDSGMIMYELVDTIFALSEYSGKQDCKHAVTKISSDIVNLYINRFDIKYVSLTNLRIILRSHGFKGRICSLLSTIGTTTVRERTISDINDDILQSVDMSKMTSLIYKFSIVQRLAIDKKVKELKSIIINDIELFDLVELSFIIGSYENRKSANDSINVHLGGYETIDERCSYQNISNYIVSEYSNDDFQTKFTVYTEERYNGNKYISLSDFYLFIVKHINSKIAKLFISTLLENGETLESGNRLKEAIINNEKIKAEINNSNKSSINVSNTKCIEFSDAILPYHNSNKITPYSYNPSIKIQCIYANFRYVTNNMIDDPLENYINLCI